MSFEQEWKELKQHAGSHDASTRMRLNQTTTPDADGTGWLVVKREDVGEVGHAAYKLWNKLRTSADIDGDKGEQGATDSAAKQLKAHSFMLGDELDRAASYWRSQVKTVLQGCAHISNHLDFSKDYHHREDRKIGTQMAAKDGEPLTPSKISKLLH
ncbi:MULTISPECIES: hypothetical protein [Streptomyces]|uniref:hypothetical protein n=2 Tax=Streptomyces TaxID=1883 RepID=UPI0004CB94A6|nr:MULTISPECIES: hypothetical protein [Streptomyces]QHF93054.1 hypothetical protein DEH18_03085 [Streptomyces sp. NHF165]